MRRIVGVLMLVLSAAVFLKVYGVGQVDTGEVEHELAIPLDSVPQNVMDAARQILIGAEFRAAEVESVLVYDLKGSVNGREVEIEVTGEGQVIEVEYEDEEDDGEPDGR